LTDTRLESVREILQRRKSEILETYRAIGVGIGKENDSYQIVVYLETPENRTDEPVSVEGVPLKFVVTGPIKPLLPETR
jgi:hypothetical protein